VLIPVGEYNLNMMASFPLIPSLPEGTAAHVKFYVITCVPTVNLITIVPLVVDN